MFSTSRSRAVFLLSRQTRVTAVRSFKSAAISKQEVASDKSVPNVSKANETATEPATHDMPLQELTGDSESSRVMQAPNRADVWSRSQNPRAGAMSGPRFEQTIIDLQPAPQAAIGLIHKQPVTWTHDRMVSCDGGGGPLGHPRIFINVDKPQICTCTYCGLPFANEHHRTHLESLPSTLYPLA